MSRTTSRTISAYGTCAWVVISPATTTMPVFASDSQATRLSGSFSSSASRIASEIWSHILSGCPSDTDSEVKRKSLSGLGSLLGLDAAEPDERFPSAASRLKSLNGAGPEKQAEPPGGRPSSRAGATVAALFVLVETALDQLAEGVEHLFRLRPLRADLDLLALGRGEHH